MLFPSITRRPLCGLCLLGLLGLTLGLTGAAPAQASIPQPVALVKASGSSRSAATTLAVSWQHWIGNRSRMIQISLVAVGLGIFILHRSKNP
jgi:hypothetical protein